ncbi:Tn7-like element transposition protein TnsE [Halomonas sp. CSM-2]|uniref:Tn7-like element transposition protein TnsE n=1 Tax=Halomonas sp. CSM-2 TaxID=1975722 RepID=UPI000A287ED5|nr:Tn7-like element transposition protein TnsE [Halomonas sp. CSM-2]
MASKKTTTTPPIKGIEDNSRVKEIGSIYRRLGSSDWRINIKLDPGQRKKNFTLSQLGLMPRRRLLNATVSGDLKPAGYEKRIQAHNASAWLHCRIGDCPIKNVREQEDWQQWCFNFESGGTRFFLPQIELARVLFFHYSYMTRLAMIPNGLDEEFDIQPGDEPGKSEIHILPTSTLPLYPRSNTAQRRVLAWILLDNEVRRSFRSIAQYQLTEGKDMNGYRHWQFRFDPPPLEDVKFSVRGQYHQESEVFFVYEIDSIENLRASSSKQVEFYDPKFAEQQAGKSGSTQEAVVPSDQLHINDDELPATDSGEYQLQVPPVILSFSKPVYTTRKSSGYRKKSGSRKGSGEQVEPSDAQSEVSTDEPAIRGEKPGGVFDGIDDQSDDTNLYQHRFEAFISMVELLKTKGCEVIAGDIRKLPVLEGHSKYRLPDGNPRCLLYRLLSYGNQNYALLEVDTSDKEKRLSTLLLKQPTDPYDWNSMVEKLSQMLVKKSLRWPTKKLDKEFPNGYKRISHQRTSLHNKLFLESDSVKLWAYRVLATFF